MELTVWLMLDKVLHPQPTVCQFCILLHLYVVVCVFPLVGATLTPIVRVIHNVLAFLRPNDAPFPYIVGT
jgi:hypothetical protein